MVVPVIVGFVSSNVIFPPLVTAVETAPILFPARSSKSIVKVTLPSVSFACVVYFAVQVFPLPAYVITRPSL